jgi:hypothetical protein
MHTDNAAVFFSDPYLGPKNDGEILIAQLTIQTTQTWTVSAELHGKTIDESADDGLEHGDDGTWADPHVTFHYPPEACTTSANEQPCANGVTVGVSGACCCDCSEIFFKGDNCETPVKVTAFSAELTFSGTDDRFLDEAVFKTALLAELGAQDPPIEPWQVRAVGPF